MWTWFEPRDGLLSMGPGLRRDDRAGIWYEPQDGSLSMGPGLRRDDRGNC
jgi:hypothetical protein